MSAAGVASRRHAAALILAGRVTGNGVVVRALGTGADPERDRIALDGERIAVASVRRTIVMHKPRGVVSTLGDPEGRPTVAALVAGAGRVYPVGRLDLNSTGLPPPTHDRALPAGPPPPPGAATRVSHLKGDGTPPAGGVTGLKPRGPPADRQ